MTTCSAVACECATARASLTRYLADRTDGMTIDWPIIIEQLCVFAKREDSRRRCVLPEAVNHWLESAT